jgi:hypothetical protein
MNAKLHGTTTRSSKASNLHQIGCLTLLISQDETMQKIQYWVVRKNHTSGLD